MRPRLYPQEESTPTEEWVIYLSTLMKSKVGRIRVGKELKSVLDALKDDMGPIPPTSMTQSPVDYELTLLKSFVNTLNPL